MNNEDYINRVCKSAFWGPSPLPEGSKNFGEFKEENEFGLLLKLRNGAIALGQNGVIKKLSKQGVKKAMKKINSSENEKIANKLVKLAKEINSGQKHGFLDVAIGQMKKKTGIDSLDALITNLIAASNFDDRLDDDASDALNDAAENLRYLLDKKILKEFDRIEKLLKRNKLL